jgi:hypothetical protein
MGICNSHLLIIFEAKMVCIEREVNKLRYKLGHVSTICLYNNLGVVRKKNVCSTLHLS